MTFANRVAWTIDPEKSALLIHDMQPHYVCAVGAAAAPMIGNVARIASACRAANAPIRRSVASCWRCGALGRHKASRGWFPA